MSFVVLTPICRSLESNHSPSGKVKVASGKILGKLATAEVLEKFAGPKVDIYVGPASKHFQLPKDIVCYYSTYFDRCFNGGFKEAQELKLTLPEDQVEHFQHLLDYMFLNGGNPLKAKGNWKQKIKYYMDFMECAGKYDLVGAVKMISDGFKEAVAESFNSKDPNMRFEPENIETVFRVLPDDHKLRGEVAVVVLKFGFATGCYQTQEKMLDGFAAEMLDQMRKHNCSSSHQPRHGPATLAHFFAGLSHEFTN